MSGLTRVIIIVCLIVGLSKLISTTLNNFIIIALAMTFGAMCVAGVFLKNIFRSE
jgi:hypothetical protein